MTTAKTELLTGEQTKEQIREKVVLILHEELNWVREGDRIVKDLGVNSRDMSRIVRRCEAVFGLTIPGVQAEGLLTVGDMVECVERVVRSLPVASL